MLRTWKWLAGVAGPNKKGLYGKHTQTAYSDETLAQVENSSLQMTSDSKNCEKNLSNYWLMKSEPESRLKKGVDVKFSTEDLRAQPKQVACCDVVRNYRAQNFHRAMKLESEDFFCHSNCKRPGMMGLKIVKDAYPDHTKFQKKTISITTHPEKSSTPNGSWWTYNLLG
ncbi:Thymocyte nuclear protein 1 [Fukomys damarensis]|uniref:Thymocyte nuclear protein 1 n=1 Tax=Fukomys damarensis TaxID=885580 RepID=A0A091DV59_FUKDA|nr:Thymocyte nuclear protein 1 [Fukomys damarensis]